MKKITLLFFVFFFSFFVQSQESTLPGKRPLIIIEEDINKTLPPIEGDIDFRTYVYGDVIILEISESLTLLLEKMRNAVGIVAIPGFGENILASGFFISDKLFVTDFLQLEQLKRSSEGNVTVWIKDQYFPVKNVKAVYEPHNLAVLEIESSYTGGVLKLSEEESPTQAAYAAGFDIREIHLLDNYYVSADRILKGLREQGLHRGIRTDDILNFMRVIDYRSTSDYQFVQLNRSNLHSSTNGLPFVNSRGEVVGVKFSNTANLAYATPVNVKLLKEVLNGKGNCEQLSIGECLDQAVENLYKKAKDQDPIAQYMHNHRLYTASIDEAIYKGNEAVRWMMSSAETGNVMSQLRSVIHLASGYQCFALPNKDGSWLSIGNVLRTINGIANDKKGDVEQIFKWLSELEKKEITLAFYLKGLMYLNGNCGEKNIERGLYYLDLAGIRGFFPALNMLIDNYSLIDGIAFDLSKADYFLHEFRSYGFKHYDPFFDINQTDERLIIQK